MLAEEEKTENTSFPEKPWKIFFWEFILFFLTLTLGIISSQQITKIIGLQNLPPVPVSSYQFIFSFLVATLIIFLIIKLLRFRTLRQTLFKIFFAVSIFLGSSLFFEIWLGTYISLALTFFLIILWLSKPNILIHDFLFITAMAGIGSVFGLRLFPLTVVILLAVFSVYDVIAVYATKHMVTMAKGMIEVGVVPGIVLPSQISGFQASLNKVELGGQFLVLGGGDIVFPLLLAVSLIPQGVLNSVIVAVSSLIGLFLSFLIFISQKTRRAMPALPPIALLSIIGYLITRIL
jgi:presenilin-like A22 family membrane protease